MKPVHPSVAIFAVAILLTMAAPGQQASSTQTPPQAPPTHPPPAQAQAQATGAAGTYPNITNTIEAGESSDDEPGRQLVSWNEYRGPYFTLRAGGGILYDTVWYAQDQASKDQFTLVPGYKLRDARVLLRGSLPEFKRKVTFSTGIMYDAPSHTWLFRETGVMVAVPELLGSIFIGRTKEGFSLNKVMVGYAGWTMERSTMSDASIPILADGIKLLGYSPKIGLMWNLGTYVDWFSRGQSFSTYSQQQVARVAWLPIRSSIKEEVLHLGINLRYGKPKDGMLQLRSRPEASPAPFFVDTGSFAAHSTSMIGYEAYYRPDNWLFGSEYWFVHTNSPSTGNPVFRGGDAAVSWIVTGESRTYNTIGGFFGPVLPKHSVFDGGPGAWELVLRYSNIDLNGGTLNGGRLWRTTPMVNWYLSDNLRLEFAYGYGQLNRFGRLGATQFFQTRTQFQF